MTVFFCSAVTDFEGVLASLPVLACLVDQDSTELRWSKSDRAVVLFEHPGHWIHPLPFARSPQCFSTQDIDSVIKMS